MKSFFERGYAAMALAIALGVSGAGLFIFLLFNIFNIVDLLKTILSLMTPIIVGFFLAYILAPVLNYFEKNLFIPLCNKLKLDHSTPRARKRIRVLSTVLTILLFSVFLEVLLSMIIPEVVRSITKLIKDTPKYLQQTNIWLAEVGKSNPAIGNNAGQYLDKIVESAQQWLSDKVLSKAGDTIKAITTQVYNVVKILLNIIVGIIVSVYILYSKEKFVAQSKKVLHAFFGKKKARRIIKEFFLIHRTFGGFITGKIVDSIIIGFICFIGCSVMQMPYAVLVSVFVGVTNVIPFVGPFIGAIPSALVILLVSPVQCLYFVIWIIILQQLDGNIIGPKILGDSTGLSAFWVIFAITLFGGLFNLLGMFLGVPVFAVIYSVLKRVCEKKLWLKNLPRNTDDYM